MALHLAQLLLPLWQKGQDLTLRQRKAQVEPVTTFIKRFCGAPRLCSTTRRTGAVLLWGGPAQKAQALTNVQPYGQLDIRRNQWHWSFDQWSPGNTWDDFHQQLLMKIMYRLRTCTKIVFCRRNCWRKYLSVEQDFKVEVLHDVYTEGA